VRRRFDACFYVPDVTPLLTDADVLPTGGAETQLFLLSQAIGRRGWRVALVASDGAGRLPASIGDVAVIPQPRLPTEANRLVRAVARVALPVIALWRARAGTAVQRSASYSTGLIGLAAKLFRMRFVYSSANVIDFDFARLEKRS